jgi:hypothetical protein
MAYFIGPQLNEEYKDYLRRVLTDGGFYSRPNPKDFQNDVDTILPLNPILYTPANAGKVSKMYSLIPDTGAGDFTVSRNGTATYFDKDGLLKTAAANVPRFEFDPLTGDFKGVLVEGSATNILRGSEGIDGTSWGKTNVSVTPNLITAPDGTLTADKIIENSENLTHGINNSLASFIGNAFYTISFFAKKSERSIIQVGGIGLLSNGENPQFDLENGVSLNTGTVGNAITNITALKNDWYKCTVVYGATGAGVLVINMLDKLDTGNAGTITGTIYQGDGTSGLFVWGVQVETGSTATSYIPTTTSTVTRPADVITVTVPTGATQCVYVLDGVETTVSVTAGSTFTLPQGLITQLYMI